MQNSFTTADLARLMNPSDANIAGNVHGGTIMKLMEEAAGVAGSRYFNKSLADSGQQTRVCALTSRVERMTFQCPVHVGDVAKVHAEVVFASAHTVAVSVKVTAERMAWSHLPNNKKRTAIGNGEDVVCNLALMWLVGVELPGHGHPVSVHKINPKDYARAKAPEFPVPDEDRDPVRWNAYQQALKAYKGRTTNPAANEVRDDMDGPNLTNGNKEPVGDHNERDLSLMSNPSQLFTPDYSAVELVQVLLPADCTTNSGLVGGGVVMKLMDNACGVVAARHCGTNVVTVAVDSVDFVAPVLIGDVLKVNARPTFTSEKSMEIEVSVIAERFAVQRSENSERDVLSRHNVVTTQRAYFTFVCLPITTGGDSDSPAASSSTLPMRPLALTSKKDQSRFEAGKRRYEQRKQNRMDP